MIKFFANENEAKDAAKIEIKNLLSNKMYINPDKFKQLIGDYRKKQLGFDSEITTAIKTQVDNILNTEEILETGKSNIDKIKQEFKKLNNVWEEDIKFHEEMELYDKVLTYRKNVKVTLDQMNDFMNMSSQLRELEEIYKEPMYFEFIQNQLFWLKELKEGVATKLETDSSIHANTMKQLLQQFVVLDEFEEKFYANIYDFIISNCLEISKQKPKALIKTLKTLDSADKHLQTLNKEPVYMKRVLTTINSSIDKRFREKFPNPNEIGEVIENVDFTVNDLIIVIENLAPCFPPEMNIFELYETKYKTNVENLVIPFLENKKKITESPGILIILASWLDKYEDLMKRAGAKETDYLELKMKIKEFMPEFILYLERYLNEGMRNIMEQDREAQDMNHLNELDEKNEANSQENEITSNFAQDLFRFIHGQLEIIGDKIKGETFMEVIRVWTTNLTEFQNREKNKLLLAVTPDERIKIVLYINNYYKCLQNISKTQELTQEYAAEALHDRIDTVISDIKKAFADSMMELLAALVDSSFVEIESEAIRNIFKQRWLEEDLMGMALATMEDYFASFKRWLLSPLHYSRCIRLAFEYLEDLYIERFLYAVKKSYKTLKTYDGKRLKISMPKDKKKEKAQEKDDKSSKKTTVLILSNTDSLIAGMEKDMNQILEYAKTYHGTVVNESYFIKVKSNFGVIFSLLKCPKFNFEEELHKVYENFKEQGVFILEAVLSIREDCDSKFKKNILEIYNNYIVK